MWIVGEMSNHSKESYEALTGLFSARHVKARKRRSGGLK